jgi:formate dehydrogenase iron-sulfur subunit
MHCADPGCLKACPSEGAIIQYANGMNRPGRTGFHARRFLTDVNAIDAQRAFIHAVVVLYDPAGVGGTHVMYVLHHADKPQLYHGLPANPSIAPVGQVFTHAGS